MRSSTESSQGSQSSQSLYSLGRVQKDIERDIGKGYRGVGPESRIPGCLTRLKRRLSCNRGVFRGRRSFCNVISESSSRKKAYVLAIGASVLLIAVSVAASV